MINNQLEVPMEKIIDFCQRYPIRKLSLFGSVLREDFRPDSDVDVLVEFEPHSGITYLDLARMQRELAAIIGRDVDLNTPDALSDYFRQKVANTAMLLYERK